VKIILRGLLMLVLASGCTVHSGGSERAHRLADTVYPYSVQREIVYTPPAWPQVLAADIFIPDGRGPFAAVLLVHGGAWESGARQELEGVATAFVKAGFAVVNVDYRLAPAFRFPAPLHDLQQAVRWVRTNAARFRIDSERIGAFGYSAGGHLVALLATVGKGDPLEAPYGGPDTRLRAAVAGGAPTDLRLYGNGRGCPEFLGGTAMELPQIHALASPVTHVTPDDPPMLLFHGGSDAIVPVIQAQVMKAALEAAGVPVELHIVRGVGHVALALFKDPVVAESIRFLDRKLRPQRNVESQ
jgi:acetyl esterase/lipase